MATATSVRYDLDPAEMRRRAGAWLDRHPEPAGRFVAVVAAGDHPLADVGRTLERAARPDPSGDDAAAMRAGYAAYEPYSRMIVVLDRDRRQPAGAARVIDDAGQGTPAMRLAPAATGRTTAEIRAAHGMDDGAPVCEFAGVAVLPEYRGKRSAVQVGTLLYRAFVRSARAAGVRHVVAVLDRATARNAVGLGTPFVPIAGSRSSAHRGTAGVRALYGDLTRFERAFAEQAARLRRAARPRGGATVRGNDLKRLAVRRVAADLAGRLSTGEGLDERIILPA
jgi:hypothetical protein